MSLTLVAAGLLFAQAGFPSAIAPEATAERREVAYEEIVSGATAAAIARLEAELASNPNDPALLINLGTAYARLGDHQRAREAYRAAFASPTRYSLELADGRWIDSRRAAQRALAMLDQRDQSPR